MHEVTRFWFWALSPEAGQGRGCRQGRVTTWQGQSVVEEEHAT